MPNKSEKTLLPQVLSYFVTPAKAGVFPDK